MVAFFVLMGAQGLVGPNAGALASAQVPSTRAPGRPCSASCSGAWREWWRPLAGLGGEHTAVPMALIILVLVGVSAWALHHLARSRPTDETPGLLP